MFVCLILVFTLLKKNFNPERSFFCYAADTRIAQSFFPQHILPQNQPKWKAMLKGGSETNSQRSHVLITAAGIRGETKNRDDELRRASSRVSTQTAPRLVPNTFLLRLKPRVPPGTTHICSPLRCKHGSPRHL